MSEPKPQQEMTTYDAARDLRIMAASIVVDHDNYKGRLLAIADWIESQFAAMLTNKSITFRQEPWPDNEITKHYNEIIASLQRDIALMKYNKAQTQADARDRQEQLEVELMKLKRTYSELETDERFQKIEQLVRGE